jgi:hypothetical protein
MQERIEAIKKKLQGAYEVKRLEKTLDLLESANDYFKRYSYGKAEFSKALTIVENRVTRKDKISLDSGSKIISELEASLDKRLKRKRIFLAVLAALGTLSFTIGGFGAYVADWLSPYLAWYSLTYVGLILFSAALLFLINSFFAPDKEISLLLQGLSAEIQELAHNPNLPNKGKTLEEESPASSSFGHQPFAGNRLPNDKNSSRQEENAERPEVQFLKTCRIL